MFQFYCGFEYDIIYENNLEIVQCQPNANLTSVDELFFPYATKRVIA